MVTDYTLIEHDRTTTYVQSGKVIIGSIDRITAQRFMPTLYDKPVSLATTLKGRRAIFKGAQRTYRNKNDALWALKHIHEARLQGSEPKEPAA